MARRIIPVVDRFMQYVSPEPNSGCWLWLGAVNSDGYGSATTVSGNRRRRVGAHRVSWEIFVGSIPPAAHVLHRCDLPCCVNPEHLFLGDNAINSRDKARKGRGVRSRIGLPFGVRVDRRRQKNPYRSKVTHLGVTYELGNFPSPEAASEAALEFKNRRLREIA